MIGMTKTTTPTGRAWLAALAGTIALATGGAGAA